MFVNTTKQNAKRGAKITTKYRRDRTKANTSTLTYFKNTKYLSFAARTNVRIPVFVLQKLLLPIAGFKVKFCITK
jgi:hypothetical protein